MPRRGTNRDAVSVGVVGAGCAAGGCDSTGCVGVGAGGGFTATGGGADTVTVTDAVAPSLVAVMVVVPAPTAVTEPVGDTVATAALPVAHCTSRSRRAPPRASRSATASGADLPTVRVREPGDRAALATGTAVTVTAA